VSGSGPLTYDWQVNETNHLVIITTVAGNGTNGFSGDGGVATNASLSNPNGIAFDSLGNIYIADSSNGRVRKVNTNGVITTVAGSGPSGVYPGDGGPATNAYLLYAPNAVVADTAGNLFIADNFRIHKVDNKGIITTIAGNGAGGYNGDGIAATNASLYYTAGLAIDALGNLLITDRYNNRIRMVNTNGIITTVAGKGGNGYTTEGVAATNTDVYAPVGLAVGTLGSFYFSNPWLQKVFKVDVNGIIASTATNESLSEPAGVAVDHAGKLFITDIASQTISKVDTNGMCAAVAGSGHSGLGDGGPATSAQLNMNVLSCMMVDGSGNLFIADTGNQRIRKIALAGYPTLSLGSVTANDQGNYRVVVTSPFGSTTSSIVALTVWTPPSIIAQPFGQSIIAGSNVTFTVGAVGTPPLNYFWQSNGLAIAGATNASYLLTNVPLTDSNCQFACIVTNAYGSVTSSISVLMVGLAPGIAGQPASQTVLNGGAAMFSVLATGTGPFSYHWQFNGAMVDNIISTVAGNGTNGYSGDGGAATNASWGNSSTIAIDSNGNIFLADYSNNRIRKINDQGTITTVAGNGTFSSTAGGVAATYTCVPGPNSIAASSAGNFYFANTWEEQVWEVTAGGITELIAGLPGANGWSGDGSVATNGGLSSPVGLAVDSFGDIFIADSGYSAIRKVDVNGLYATVTNLGLGSQVSLIADSSGDLFVSDSYNMRVIMVDTQGNMRTVAGNGLVGFSGDGGAATNASLNGPSGLAIDVSGDLFIADSHNHCVRKVNSGGIITTIAGCGVEGYGGDGSVPTNALLAMNNSSVVAVDASGDIYILDDQHIRRVSPINASLPFMRINSVSSANAGSYSVIVSSAFGCVTSSVAVLTVGLGYSPSIIIPPGSLSASCGTDASFSVTVAGSSPFSYEWLSNGIPVLTGTNSNFILSNVQPAWSGTEYSVVITNFFGCITSTVGVLTVPIEAISTSVLGNGQIQISPAATNYYLGQTFTLTAVPGRYYAFTQWNDSLTNNPRPIVINSNNVYTAIFTNTVPLDTYTINGLTFQVPVGTPVALVNGQYSPSNSFAIAVTNTIQVSLQTTFANGYIFYTTDGTEPDFTADAYSGPFTLAQSSVIWAIAYTSDGTAYSEADPVTISVVPVYNLTNTTPGGGSVAFNPPGGTYLSNTVVTCTATASNGWTFMGWSGLTASLSNPVSVTVNDSTSLTAIFGTTISTSTNVAGATVALWPAVGSYAYGSTVRFVAVPPVGKSFARWFNVFTGPTNNPFNYVVTTNNPVASAFFSTVSAGNFTLTTLLNGYGTVTRSPYANYYASNSTVQLTAVPDTNYVFSGWSGNGSGRQNPLTVILNSNLVITATFNTNTMGTNKAMALVTLGNLNQVYDGAAEGVSVATVPAGLTVNLAYNGSANAPTNAGSYTVVATVVDANYQGGATNTLVIGQATASVTANNTNRAYGAANPAFTGTLVGVANGDNITANYSTTAVTNSAAGTYPIIPSLVDPNGRLANYNVMTNNGVLTIIAPPLVSIAWLRSTLDPVTYAPTNTTSLFTITGVVTTWTNLTSSANTEFYMQDGTAGIAIYWSGAAASNNLPPAGSIVQVTAPLGDFAGLLEPTLIFGNTLHSVTVLGSTNLPAPRVLPFDPLITGNPDIMVRQLQGSYFVISNAFLDLSSGSVFTYLSTGEPVTNANNVTYGLNLFNPTNMTAGTNYVISVTNQNSQTSTIFYSRYTDIIGQTKVTGPVTIYGVLGQYVTNTPYTSGYEFTPTRFADIVPLGIAPAISWTNPAPITYGMALSSNQLNATTTVPGSFAYLPAAGAALNAGSNLLTVVFTPINTVNYSSATSTVCQLVLPAGLTVTANSASRIYGQPNPALTGTLTGVTNGDLITATYSTTAATNSPVGTYPIIPGVVDPAGRLVNYTVTTSNGVLTINKAAATVTLGGLNQVYDGAAVGVSVATLPASLLVNVTYNGSPNAPTNVGSYTVVGTVVDANYQGAVTNTLVISKSPPVFLFGAANYSVNESNGVVVVTVLNNGMLGGLVNYSTYDGTAYGGSGFSGSYRIAQGSLTFGDGQQSTNLTIGIIDNYLDGPDIQFSVQLFNPSAGTLGTPATATVTIHQNDLGVATNSLVTIASPSAQPPTSGALTMMLTPPDANGQWRFAWELGWHPSGYTETSLQAGNYPVEFQDVPNYLAFPATLTVAVTNNGTTIVTNTLLPTYTSFDTNSTGSLTVDIGPNAPAGCGWRFIGESAWRSNSVTVSSLLPDTYFIQYAPVSGYSSPASQAVVVASGQGSIVSANYALAGTPPAGASLPSQVVSSLITDIRDYPYGFNGQLESDMGYGSGVAVRQTVVLTAAHMVFNDATLAYVNQAYWSFQEEAGTFSPEPLPARGWYVLSGYAAQRTNDLGTGGYGVDASSPQSRELDVAALYFTAPAARGGYGGYLASDAVPNPYLTGSSLKLLAGYPVDGTAYGQVLQPGTMYATAAQPAAFALATNDTYTTASFLSFPGNSGGPVYVQYNNYYYPAAVYLGTLGSGQNSVSVVRAITSDVVNLINLASSEGDAGTNYTGGGVITLLAGQASVVNPAFVQVNLGPAAAISAGAGWRLQGQSSYGSDPQYTLTVTGGSAVLQFKPISGWNVPTNQTLSVAAGQVTVVMANYTVAPSADLVAGLSGPATVQAASNYLYLLLITNLGPSAASSVTVTDTLPAGVTFLGATGGGTNRAGIVTWPVLASLPNGGTTNYTLTVKAPTSGYLTNLISVGAAALDTNSANHTAAMVTLVIIAPPLLVANAASGFGIAGTTGTTYRVEYCTNLATARWLPLQTNTVPTAGVTNVLIWSTTNGPTRFYRAVWLP